MALLLASCDSGLEPIVPIATTISIADGTLTLSWLGATDQVVATVLDQSGDRMSSAQATWASSDVSVATVTSDGLVTAVDNGDVIVTVRSGAASALVSVEVAQVAVSLSLSADTAVFGTLGDTIRVGVTLQDFGGSDVQGAVADWLALDPSVATVSSDGLITAVGNGATVVAATSSGFVATTSVTVAQTPSQIGVSADSVTLASLGDTVRLVASVFDPGGAAFDDALVSWTSSDSAVAIVSSDGLVTALDNGVAAITAAAGTVFIETAVTVEQIVASVSLMPDSIVLADVGNTASLTATVLDALGSAILAPTLVWASTDDVIAMVDSVGVVTAVATGSVSISAESGGRSSSIVARVVPELTLLVSGPGTVDAEVASSVSLSVRVEDLLGAAYEGATVTWSIGGGGGSITSSSESTSDASGHAGAVWALGTGAGAQNASASIATRGSTVVVGFVANASAAVATDAFLVADSALLSAAGETIFLAPTFEDAYGNVALPTVVSWSSSDPSVAIVGPGGLVTGRGAGTTYVTASLASPTDSILVTVDLRGAITITFDDGWLTTYTEAWPVLQEFNLAGNVGVYTGAVGFPAYMSQAQLQELHDDGWTLVSHTVSHDTLTTLSDAVLDYELRTSQQWLDDRGFGRGSRIFIAPYHVFANRERAAASTYYGAARGASANAVMPDTMVFWQPSNPYELTGIDVDQLPYTTIAGRDRLRTMLQRTLDEGRFLDVLFHQLPAANVPALRETLTILNEFRDRVLPYHELYPEFARVVG